MTASKIASSTLTAAAASIAPKGCEKRLASLAAHGVTANVERLDRAYLVTIGTKRLTFDTVAEAKCALDGALALCETLNPTPIMGTPKAEKPMYADPDVKAKALGV